MRESGENYLEAVYLLTKGAAQVRSIDVCAFLSFSKPSVSRAMGILKKNGLITMDRQGLISMTQEGRLAAEKIYQRHLLITRFLMLSLGLDETSAERDACRIEHIIGEETFEKIKEYVNNAQS